MNDPAPVVIIGAGPAGLAAAYELGKSGVASLVLEKDSVVGGLSRTVEYKGFRCDIGGHRFFSKSAYVNRLWRETLGGDFLRRCRRSRILYAGKLYDYPLRIGNVLGNMGVLASVAVVASLVRSKLFPYRPEVTFRQWVSNHFGRRLFEALFRPYTEKVWGVSCDRISADWAAQRIGALSLGKAILRALGLGRNTKIASLIDRFDYPALGPGQMYEALAAEARRTGAEIRLGTRVEAVEHAGGRVTAVLVRSGDRAERHPVGRACFSSMPLDELVRGLRPCAPAEVLAAADGLRYRSIITVNLLLNQARSVPDTWIYVHDPDIPAARVQFYKNWSPRMVPDESRSVVGLEYFCTEGDDFWSLPDEQLCRRGRMDLDRLGFAGCGAVFDAFAVRYAKAYPLYDEGYARRVSAIRRFLQTLANLYPIGRYGQFRYNNMDHSILTARCAVLAMQGGNVDPWSVNLGPEYVEKA